MDAARARELLARERGRIERALGQRGTDDGDDAQAVDQQSADQGSDLNAEEIEQGLAEQLREELAAVERAEQRVEEGTYGLSVDSGDPIPDGRLEAIPWAERTAAEQSRYEGG